MNFQIFVKKVQLQAVRRTTMTQETVVAPLPHITYIKIARRSLADGTLGDNWANVPWCFLPPNSTHLWPKTMRDIGNTEMEQALNQAGNDAVGILVNGTIYTDDSIFWLSKIGHSSPGQFVYKRPKNSTKYAERVKFFSNTPWSYVDEHPHYVPPPPDTLIQFENLWEWDQFKARYNMEWKYGTSDPIDAPRPYQL